MASLAYRAWLSLVLLVIVWRLQDEERMLARELPRYAGYRTRVRWRLLPGVW